MSETKRIFHRYEKWECFQNGFFSNSIDEKETLRQRVIDLFTDPEETKIYMDRVIIEWPHSCEHNLTNAAMNRIAWLGQAACCIFAEVPFKITMQAWNDVPKEFQDKADSIADEIIKNYLDAKNIPG